MSYGRDFFTTTSNQMIKINNLSFRTIDIISDFGWLFEEEE
jgi:hypothetical protein